MSDQPSAIQRTEIEVGESAITRTPRLGVTLSHDHTAAASDGGALTNDLHDGYLEIVAIGTPSNPPVNSWRFFSRINGTNIELVCRAPLGGECILCTKPNTAVAGSGELMGILGLTYP